MHDAYDTKNQIKFRQYQPRAHLPNLMLAKVTCYTVYNVHDTCVTASAKTL